MAVYPDDPVWCWPDGMVWSQKNMTPLAKLIYRDIETNGPMNIAQYMVQCLCHPKHGYYMKKDPLGASGDFTTAPEVSQAFGEILGLWSSVFWQQIGAPSTFHLVELGPGRGTLMKDALRATKMISGFHEALKIHFVEVSPALKAIQEEAFKDSGFNVNWHEAYEDIPDGPALFIANEFFDALPIRQFEYGEKGWAERFVDLSSEEGFRFVLKPDQAASALMPPSLQGTHKKGLFEISPTTQSIAYGLGKRISEQGGGILIIDYGHEKSGFGDTFQALKDHEYVSVFDHCGDADLTAHVDFETLAHSFKEAGAKVIGMLGQGEFLERLGITQRVQSLYDHANEKQREELVAGHRRLCHPEEMGSLFKVLCVTNSNQPDPIGFE